MTAINLLHTYYHYQLNLQLDHLTDNIHFAIQRAFREESINVGSIQTERDRNNITFQQVASEISLAERIVAERERDFGLHGGGYLIMSDRVRERERECQIGRGLAYLT